MKNELENLSKEELIKIADHYSINGVSNMPKKEIINRILEINGYIKTPTKKEKDVVYKTSWRQKAYHIMFLSLILISILTTLQNLINAFYFYPKIYGYNGANDLYGNFLTLASTGWSIYVYRMWIKTKTIHSWLIISAVLSIGWFIYRSINNHDLVKLFNDNKDTNRFSTSLYNNLKAFMISYWTFIGLISALSFVSISCWLIRM